MFPTKEACSDREVLLMKGVFAFLSVMENGTFPHTQYFSIIATVTQPCDPFTGVCSGNELSRTGARMSVTDSRNFLAGALDCGVGTDSK